MNAMNKKQNYTLNCNGLNVTITSDLKYTNAQTKFA